MIKKIIKRLQKDKDLKHLAKGGTMAFIINCMGFIASYLFIGLLSKIYKSSSATIYGEYILITVVIRIASILTRFGTDTTMLRLTPALASRNKWTNIFDINKKLLRILLVFGTVASFAVILVSGFWAGLFKVSQSMIIQSGFFVIPVALGLFYSQSLRGLKNVGISSFLSNSALPTLNLIFLLIIFPFFKNSSIFNYLPVYTYFLSSIIIIIIGYAYWHLYTKNKPREKIDEQENKTIKQLLIISYPLVLTQSMTFLINWVEQLMIGALGNTKDVGIYNVCNRYTTIATLSLMAINQVSAANFSEYYYQKDFDRLRKYVLQTTKLISLTSIPVLVCFIIFPKFFLGIFGSSFNEGWQALIILSIGTIANVATGSVALLLNMTGHQKIVQNVLIFIIIVEILLNLLLIPGFGITGAAIASGICFILRNLIFCFYVKKYFGFWSFYIPFVKNR